MIRESSEISFVLSAFFISLLMFIITGAYIRQSTTLATLNALITSFCKLNRSQRLTLFRLRRQMFSAPDNSICVGMFLRIILSIWCRITYSFLQYKSATYFKWRYVQTHVLCVSALHALTKWAMKTHTLGTGQSVEFIKKCIMLRKLLVKLCSSPKMKISRIQFSKCQGPYVFILSKNHRPTATSFPGKSHITCRFIVKYTSKGRHPFRVDGWNLCEVFPEESSQY